ncbi:hypothetical protein [Amycolatopsis sp. H20-H5]|uniref:hypothetical protein n=1 Tax=Amycolatopsis sp. H20-H5 TaxID=3046309 RepID=UPI002DBD1FD8|nr:hypothetical protein [Amycolatopsis sp. H20-H5]MEC3976907.1 hypothetical protein [Amycolatopsis sp. H20-H5]
MAQRNQPVPQRRSRPRHHLRKGWRAAGVAISLLALLATTGPAAASPATPAARPGGCGPALRALTLAVDQQRVLNLLGDLTVIRNDADLKRLATPNTKADVTYDILPHFFVSMGGVGFTVVQENQEIRPGKPTLLFYRPSPKAKDVLDPFGIDYPYVLAGWGYGGHYTPGVRPSFPRDPGLACLTDSDWFIHERSVHPADNWQNVTVPPAEAWHGQAEAAIPPTPADCARCTGMPHGRLWDLHLWISPNRVVPQVSIFNPGKPIPGFDAVAGVGFFYPDSGPPAAPAAPADHSSMAGMAGMSGMAGMTGNKISSVPGLG